MRKAAPQGLSARDRILRLDPWILGLVGGLVIFGLIVLMSATGPIAFQRTQDSLYYVKHQILSGIFPGMFLFAFFAVIDYRILKRIAPFFLVGTLALLFAVYIPGLGVNMGGAQSWIALGSVQFQPSELVKLTFLIYLAAWLSERAGGKAHDLHEGLIPFAGMLGGVALLLVIQPDTGTAAVVIGTAMIMYLASGAPLIWFAGLVSLGAGAIAFLVKSSPYRAARFMTFLHPELDPQGIGYHINQAILAIGSGGILGMGYGKSRQKYLYLPEVEADSIFAVMAEELGFIITTLFVVVFSLLVWRCFKIALESRDPFAAYLAIGIGAWLGIQGLVNLMSMTGLMPMTGVTLPFISHGGTSMAVMLGAMGIIAGIPRHNGREFGFGRKEKFRQYGTHEKG